MTWKTKSFFPFSTTAEVCGWIWFSIRSFATTARDSLSHGLVAASVISWINLTKLWIYGVGKGNQVCSLIFFLETSIECFAGFCSNQWVQARLVRIIHRPAKQRVIVPGYSPKNLGTNFWNRMVNRFFEASSGVLLPQQMTEWFTTSWYTQNILQTSLPSKEHFLWFQCFPGEHLEILGKMHPKHRGAFHGTTLHE